MTFRELFTQIEAAGKLDHFAEFFDNTRDADCEDIYTAVLERDGKVYLEFLDESHSIYYGLDESL